MKKILIAFVFILISVNFYAQSNQNLANIYFKKAEKSLFEEIYPEKALIQFDKALTFTNTITNAHNAWLGTRIHYELSNLRDCKKYAKQYFALEDNKGSDKYNQFLDLHTLIEEELQQEIAKEKELQRIESLKKAWKNKSNELTIKVDSIYTFNKKNVALFQKNKYYGVINDRGEILIKANEYKIATSFDGYFVFTNKENNPTKVYVYNTTENTGFNLPNVSTFNAASTHYGKVMLPRGNGRIIAYPNNSNKVMVYDLIEMKFVQIANEKELFKSLKKSKKISKYRKDGTIKIKKEWYGFGGHIGGGIHPLFVMETSNLTGFLFSINGAVSRLDKFSYLGAFYNNKAQAVKNGRTFWINQNGRKTRAPKDESGVYTGNSKVRRLKNEAYQITQNGVIVLGNQKLEKMENFLRKNNSKK